MVYPIIGLGVVSSIVGLGSALASGVAQGAAEKNGVSLSGLEATLGTVAPIGTGISAVSFGFLPALISAGFSGQVRGSEVGYGLGLFGAIGAGAYYATNAIGFSIGYHMS